MSLKGQMAGGQLARKLVDGSTRGSCLKWKDAARSCTCTNIKQFSGYFLVGITKDVDRIGCPVSRVIKRCA